MPNVEALQQLRRVVIEAPEEQFDMRWYETWRASCGTTRCAAGWAAHDPWHQQNTTINQIFPITEVGGEKRIEFRQPVGHYDEFENLAEIYGISFEDSLELFDSGSVGATKAQVIASIDRAISGMPILPYRKEDHE